MSLRRRWSVSSLSRQGETGESDRPPFLDDPKFSKDLTFPVVWGNSFLNSYRITAKSDRLEIYKKRGVVLSTFFSSSSSTTRSGRSGSKKKSKISDDGWTLDLVIPYENIDSCHCTAADRYEGCKEFLHSDPRLPAAIAATTVAGAVSDGRPGRHTSMDVVDSVIDGGSLDDDSSNSQQRRKSRFMSSLGLDPSSEFRSGRDSASFYDCGGYMRLDCTSLGVVSYNFRIDSSAMKSDFGSDYHCSTHDMIRAVRQRVRRLKIEQGIVVGIDEDDLESELMMTTSSSGVMITTEGGPSLSSSKMMMIIDEKDVYDRKALPFGLDHLKESVLFRDSRTDFNLDDRVRLSRNPLCEGPIRYKGLVPFAPGLFYGIEINVIKATPLVSPLSSTSAAVIADSFAFGSTCDAPSSLSEASVMSGKEIPTTMSSEDYYSPELRRVKSTVAGSGGLTSKQVNHLRRELRNRLNMISLIDVDPTLVRKSEVMMGILKDSEMVMDEEEEEKDESKHQELITDPGGEDSLSGDEVGDAVGFAIEPGSLMMSVDEPGKMMTASSSNDHNNVSDNETSGLTLGSFTLGSGGVLSQSSGMDLNICDCDRRLFVSKSSTQGCFHRITYFLNHDSVSLAIMAHESLVELCP